MSTHSENHEHGTQHENKDEPYLSMEDYKVLYDEIMDMYDDVKDDLENFESTGEYEMDDYPFKINNCECYYSFNLRKTYKNELVIDINIKLKDVKYSECSDYNINCSFEISELNLESFKEKFDAINTRKIRKDNVLVYLGEDFHSIALLTEKQYKKRISLSKLFFSKEEMNKCYVCLNWTLPSERTLCGHNIHIQCALQQYNHMDSIPNDEQPYFKCGICRKQTSEIILNKCRNEHNHNQNE